MAAQARHYEKGIAYSSRQVDDKYIASKSRHSNTHSQSHLKNSSRETSPHRSSTKSNSSHSSPSGRKRNYHSPNSKFSNSNSSPYDGLHKKDRLNVDMGKNDCQSSVDHLQGESKVENNEMAVKKVTPCRRCPINGFKEDNDWSEHRSSSGKIYYYNKRTEESQWEVPKGWSERRRELKDNLEKDRTQPRGSHNLTKDSSYRDDFHDIRESRDMKDHKYKEKNASKEHRSHEESNRRDRDVRKTRERDARDRDRDRERDRGYRDRESRDYDGKHRMSSGSSKRDNKYVSSSISTAGQSSSSSSISHSNHPRSYHRRPSPESLNGSGSGSVQDISPPGTPTNDDTVVSTMPTTPAPLYTTHVSSSLVTTAISTTRVLPLPTTPHTPLLSPIVHSSTTHLSTSYLHPLQQALLLQQQQATTTTPNKDAFGSPKLPTVKTHVTEVGTSTPTSSPRVTSASFSSSNQKPVPMIQSPDISSNRSDSATPPPPPPPPKENRQMPDTKELKTQKLDRQSSLSTSTTTTAVASPTAPDYSTKVNDLADRTKILHDTIKKDETPVKTQATSRTYSERLIKRTIKLERPEPVSFTDLPDLDKYSEYFSPSVAEFHTAFYCNALENQIYSVWDETMNLLHTEGFRSKFSLSISKQHIDCEDSKLEISSGWVDALNAVIQKVESLQDSNLSSDSRMANREANKKKNRTESTSSGASVNESLMNSSTSLNTDHMDGNNMDLKDEEPVSRVKEKELLCLRGNDDTPPPPPPPPLPNPPSADTFPPSDGSTTNVAMEEEDTSAR